MNEFYLLRLAKGKQRKTENMLNRRKEYVEIDCLRLLTLQASAPEKTLSSSVINTLRPPKESIKLLKLHLPPSPSENLETKVIQVQETVNLTNSMKTEPPTDPIISEEKDTNSAVARTAAQMTPGGPKIQRKTLIPKVLAIPTLAEDLRRQHLVFGPQREDSHEGHCHFQTDRLGLNMLAIKKNLAIRARRRRLKDYLDEMVKQEQELLRKLAGSMWNIDRPMH